MCTTKRKPYDIDKRLVEEAYQLVKGNAGSAGVDKETIERFEGNLEDNLYKIWNRMSSGSYLPPPVRGVPIPKKSGGQRLLGIPTVADRVAQTVVKRVIESKFEEVFLPDSYGYRPGKSAHDAIGVTRERCWKYDWVLEFDIKGMFDNIDHDLLLKAVRKHVTEEWALLYIERWLKAPMELADGTRVDRPKGTPQGGVVSPLLANLFMHYVFDIWMKREYPHLPWCRYADDGLVHCRTREEAQNLKDALQKRLAECGLEMHPTKTRIVYCKDANRTGKYPDQSFDFLGYTFRPRKVKNKHNQRFVSFTPAVSKASLHSMREKIRGLHIRRWTHAALDDIARKINPILRGWIAYYGRYCPSALYPLYRHVNKTLVSWARRKYKRLKGSKTRTGVWLQSLARKNPGLLVHWQQNTIGAFN